MLGRDHHQALKTSIITSIDAGGLQIVLAALQGSKTDKWFTLHVNPTTFSTAGLQLTDWLAYLGFQRYDQCSFIPSRRCYSREVHEGFDVLQFVSAFNAGFVHLKQAQAGLEACGFNLPQPEGWNFYSGRNNQSGRSYHVDTSSDGHTAMTHQILKTSEDKQFFFKFTFIEIESRKYFVTHYRPKHPPMSSEVCSVFSFLSLRKFNDCPEFDFEPCYFRAVPFEARSNLPWESNAEYAHRCFDAHQTQFSPAIESLLAASAVMEPTRIAYVPMKDPNNRIQSDIASNFFQASKQGQPSVGAPSALPDIFDVAISFAGTERAQAEILAKIVREAGYTVFYDNFYPEHLWGKNLAIFFDEIFRKRSRFCVVFVSKDYRDRKWTIHEARSAQARALEEKGSDYILPIRVDDAELEGLLPTVGYVSIDIGVENIGRLLLKKLESTRG